MVSFSASYSCRKVTSLVVGRKDVVSLLRERMYTPTHPGRLACTQWSRMPYSRIASELHQGLCLMEAVKCLYRLISDSPLPHHNPGTSFQVLFFHSIHSLPNNPSNISSSSSTLLASDNAPNKNNPQYPTTNPLTNLPPPSTQQATSPLSRNTKSEYPNIARINIVYEGCRICLYIPSVTRCIGFVRLNVKFCPS
jgi:hypothetical protein